MTDAITAAEREAAHIARKINVSYGRTLRKWIDRGRQYRPLVDRLRPLIAEFDKSECWAESERKAILAARNAQ